MGKQSVKEKPKVLFNNPKNSNTTINTYTKTYSGISQSCTKSLILQLKKKIPDNNYYEDNGVLKRDLSIETDICILRRYYKANKGKIQNKQTTSARSKYSINNTEIDTITEIKADTSASGDSEPKTGNTPFNVDLTTLVIDNLKTLLNEWIRNYLLENDETKQKIETVLDSLLHKVELEHSSSSCTYNLDIKVKRNSFDDDATVIMAGSDRDKISSLTIPLTGQNLKLISTLSVPKKPSNALKKKKKRTRFQQDNTIDSPSKLLLNSSHYNVLEITTESFTKRFATYQEQRKENTIEYKTFRDIRHFKPRSSHTTISSVQCLKKNDINFNEEYLKHSMKHNYINNKEHKFIDKIDSTIPDEKSHTSSNIFIKDTNKSVIAAQFTKYKSSQLKIPQANRKHYKRRKNIVNKKKPVTYPSIKNIKTKKFSFSNKSPNRFTQQKEFLKHIKKILNSVEKCKYISNIKVNIQVNVYQNSDTEYVVSSPISRHENICKFEKDTRILYNIKSKISNTGPHQMNIECKNENEQYSRAQKKIISLLDGAVSQTEYITSFQTTPKKSKDSIENRINMKNKNTDTSSYGIVQDLGEIKNIIKDLSIMAQNMVIEHLSKQLKMDPIKPDIETSKLNFQDKSLNDSQRTKKSKEIQCSNLETRNVLTSGLKLRKGPKSRDTKNEELNIRLTKKSTSYQIIESESVLKVHDMTSAAQIENLIENQVSDKALTCSLPKSKSLFELSGTNNQKLLAFYCDECTKPTNCIYEAGIPYTSEMCSFCSHPRNFSTIKYCSRECSGDLSPLLIECNNKNCKNIQRDKSECENENSCSSVYIEIDENTCDKKFVVRKRSVSFKEGCVYCILLWIPVLIISWFFYVFTLKDFIASKQNTSLRLSSVTSSSSPFPISLTDLDIIIMQQKSGHKLLNSSSKKDYRPKSASLHPPRSTPASYLVAFSFNETIDNVQTEQTHYTLENNSSIKPRIVEPAANTTYYILNTIINDIVEKIGEIETNNETKTSNCDTHDIIIKEQDNLVDKINSKNFFVYIPSSNDSTDTICYRNKCELLENPSNVTLKKYATPNSSHNDIKKDTSSSIILLSTKKSSLENICQLNEVNIENDSRYMLAESMLNIHSDNSKLKIDIKHIGEIKSDDITNSSTMTLCEQPNIKPYKTSVINVSLAQVGNRTIAIEKVASHNKAKILNENIISTETNANEKCDSTSADALATKDLVSKIFNENNFHEYSDATLVGSIASQMSSQKERFFLASTGSSLNKTDESNYTITSYCSSTNTDLIENNSVPIIKDKTNNISTAPSASNINENKCYTNNVIIAEGLQKLYPLKSKGDNLSLDKFAKNLWKKSLDIKNSGIFKNITLPNEATIKEIITDRENSQKISCSEESRNFQPFPDLWDKLTVALDLAIKKLEESLSERILGELSMALQKFERYAQLISNEELKKKQSWETHNLNKIETGALELNNDECMQCNLIQSHAIDNLIQQKMSTETERGSKTKVLNKMKLSKTLQDSFEILKAYTEPRVIKQLGDGDSVKISAGNISFSPTRTRLLFRGPLRFLRENYFVISSVPAFFFCVFLIYGFVVLLIKLW